MRRPCLKEQGSCRRQRQIRGVKKSFTVRRPCLENNADSYRRWWPVRGVQKSMGREKTLLKRTTHLQTSMANTRSFTVRRPCLENNVDSCRRRWTIRGAQKSVICEKTLLQTSRTLTGFAGDKECRRTWAMRKPCIERNVDSYRRQRHWIWRRQIWEEFRRVWALRRLNRTWYGKLQTLGTPASQKTVMEGCRTAWAVRRPYLEQHEQL